MTWLEGDERPFMSWLEGGRNDWAARIRKNWPLLVVTLWRPPVTGLEGCGWQHCDTKLYETGVA